VALVHDWLVAMRGGEKVLEAVLEVFPQADLFTLVARRGRLSPGLRDRDIRTSLLQRLPFGPSHYRWFLPAFGWFMGRLDLSGYDLVFSSSSACAKWVRTPRGVPHVCYCHTPMRYVWDLFDDYFSRASWPVRTAARAFRGRLQRRDLESNRGVTHFLANSREVQGRIRRLYDRDSTVLPPPVEVDRFPAPPDPRRGGGDYHLVVSALVPYKRVDLAVEACNRLKEPLLVVGEGDQLRRLKAMAGPTVTFRGWAGDGELPALYAGARSLLFPGLEDFGIVPVEAIACGCPVVAYGKGGVLDTLEDGVTGTLFGEQTVEGLLDAMERMRRMRFDPAAMRARAGAFSRGSFTGSLRGHLREWLGLAF
jgi:glycosyltransferase involved in cell wall biosynthesis